MNTTSIAMFNHRSDAEVLQKPMLGYEHNLHRNV
jgi:hypothetical protein